MKARDRKRLMELLEIQREEEKRDRIAKAKEKRQHEAFMREVDKVKDEALARWGITQPAPEPTPQPENYEPAPELSQRDSETSWL